MRTKNDEGAVSRAFVVGSSGAVAQLGLGYVLEQAPGAMVAAPPVPPV
jgi:hypothetical protein